MEKKKKKKIKCKTFLKTRGLRIKPEVELRVLTLEAAVESPA